MGQINLMIDSLIINELKIKDKSCKTKFSDYNFLKIVPKPYLHCFCFQDNCPDHHVYGF